MVTQMLSPALLAGRALTLKCVAGPGSTRIVMVPNHDRMTVSVIVTVWAPAVFSLKVAVRTPFSSARNLRSLASNSAWRSVQVQRTVPV